MDKSIVAGLIGYGVPEEIAGHIGFATAAVIIIAIALIAFWLTNRILVRLVESAFMKSKNRWDDIIVKRHLVKRLSLLVPVLVIYLAIDLLLPEQAQATDFFKRLTTTFFVLVSVRVLDSILLSVLDIYSSSEIAGERPIRGYVNAIKITAYLLAGIFIISIITDKSPWGVLSLLGGFTVVLMLVFKDTILGFVANLQLYGQDMVRIGDWIEMPKYGADGDVIDISVHTVKVQNWDKTITTIPTYALVSDTFKNWRGMAYSGGRRIKRSLNIDISSIKFCSDEMLDRFAKYGRINDYIQSKIDEISAYNQEHGIDTNQLINGRRQTNVGVFRAYIVAYLKNHPQVNQDMTFLVRHLEPTPSGLPIQIYVFSSDKAWANYEAIQADIFDHLLAAAPEFDLRIFQNPTGHDFSGWQKK